jgi:hypothetical protein
VFATKISYPFLFGAFRATFSAHGMGFVCTLHCVDPVARELHVVVIIVIIIIIINFSCSSSEITQETMNLVRHLLELCKRDRSIECLPLAVYCAPYKEPVQCEFRGSHSGPAEEGVVECDVASLG